MGSILAKASKAAIGTLFNKMALLYVLVIMAAAFFFAYALSPEELTFSRFWKALQMAAAFPLIMAAFLVVSKFVAMLLSQDDKLSERLTVIIFLALFVLASFYSFLVVIDRVEFAHKAQGAFAVQAMPALSKHQLCRDAFLAEFYIEDNKMIVRCGEAFWPNYKEFVLVESEYKETMDRLRKAQGY